MEYIRANSATIQKAGIHFFIASIEAIGMMFLFAKITNRAIETWNAGLSILLYLLLVVLLLLIFGRKDK